MKGIHKQGLDVMFYKKKRERCGGHLDKKATTFNAGGRRRLPSLLCFLNGGFPLLAAKKFSNISLVMIVILIFSLNGCHQSEGDTYQLDFFEVANVKIANLPPDNSYIIIEQLRIDDDISVFLFKDSENSHVHGGINLKDKFYDIGEVSVDRNLMGIEEVQVFGEKAVKIYGILGANYAQAFYFMVDQRLEESVIQVDGNTVEIDLDDDGQEEIVSTSGTIPETKIFLFKEGTIYVSDINKSIGAKSVSLQNDKDKLFQVYFDPNKPKQYVYYKGSLYKK